MDHPEDDNANQRVESRNKRVAKVLIPVPLELTGKQSLTIQTLWCGELEYLIAVLKDYFDNRPVFYTRSRNGYHSYFCGEAGTSEYSLWEKQMDALGFEPAKTHPTASLGAFN